MAGIKIKKLKPQKLAYIEHTGDYSNIPYDEYYEKLFSWAKEKNLRPGFKGMGIFHDNPDITPPEQCRSEICIPIIGNVESEGEVKIKELPQMEVAVIKHKGTNEEYKNTYKALNDWISENGYEWAGPSMEVYGKKPRAKGEEKIVYATVQAPVRKKGQLLRKVVEKDEVEEAQEAGETQKVQDIQETEESGQGN